MDLRVQKVIALMERNLHRELSLSGLAQAVNLSSSHLRCVFRAETGLPPAQYLRLLRMREAQVLLVNSFLRVKEIAARVGMCDESHFVRNFKKTYGLTPTQHRARRNYRGRRVEID